MIHSTSLLGLLKEVQGQNLQNFVPAASAYAFGRRPNFLKWELWLRLNVKNMALVIHCTIQYSITYILSQCQKGLAQLIVTGIQQLMNNEIKAYRWFQPFTFLMLDVHCTILTIYICTWFRYVLWSM